MCSNCNKTFCCVYCTLTVIRFYLFKLYTNFHDAVITLEYCISSYFLRSAWWFCVVQLVIAKTSKTYILLLSFSYQMTDGFVVWGTCQEHNEPEWFITRLGRFISLWQDWCASMCKRSHLDHSSRHCGPSYRASSITAPLGLGGWKPHNDGLSYTCRISSTRLLPTNTHLW